MKILIAEDDLSSRKYLGKLLEVYGDCDFAVNGIEAVEAYVAAVNTGEHYDLICLDVMMPKIDGIRALKAIRDIEKQKNNSKLKPVRIMLVSALSDSEIDLGDYRSDMDSYIAKPIIPEELYDHMGSLGFSKLS